MYSWRRKTKVLISMIIVNYTESIWGQDLQSNWVELETEILGTIISFVSNDCPGHTLLARRVMTLILYHGLGCLVGEWLFCS